MSREKQLIEWTHEKLGGPPTEESMVRQLKEIGVNEGMLLLVHSAMSTIGWVPGGAVAVIRALQRAVGPEGTLVMPTHTGNLSEPSRWQNPPAPESWWQTIREQTPAFDPQAAPVYGMGVIPETFRKMSDVKRSSHPHVSFAAWGRLADEVLRGHGEDATRLGEALGEESPIGRVYAHDGSVLLVGVGYDSNTSLHLAEYRADYRGKKQEENCAPVLVHGVRQWVCYTDIEYDTDDFERIGADFEREAQDRGDVAVGRIGLAESRLIRQRKLVDFATEWMERNRGR
jgi:aminoglycoside 3-N-acetyltransferase